MNFLYYVPGLTYAEIDGDALRARGLAGTFRDAFTASGRLMTEQLQVRQVHHHGPDGGAGVIVAMGEALDERPLGFFSDRQEWQSCPGGAFWLGYDRQSGLPAPHDLQRPTLTAGYPVLLGDGNIWEVPTIRRGGRYSTLPQRMAIDWTGEFSMSVLAEFDFAWQASGEIFEHVFKSRDIPFREVLRLCVDVLSLNYRVGLHEASRLGLITTQNFAAVFEAAVDWPKIIELIGAPTEAGGIVPQKKKESGSENASI